MTESTAPRPDGTPRRPYRAPHLVVHGELRDLTRMNGGTRGMNDGGAGPDKTGF